MIRGLFIHMEGWKNTDCSLEKLQFGMESGQSDDDQTHQHPLTRGTG